MVKSDLEVLEEFILNNKELELLEEMINDFNIFTALNITDHELRHSDFLSWLLNPNESHGMGDYFLILFLKKVAYKARSSGIEGPSIFDIENLNLEDAEVLREWKNIDILIRDESQKFLCSIENKIASPESKGQLKRYKETIDMDYPAYNKLFVFLTVEGERPSEEMQQYYIQFSHKEIMDIIEHLIENKKDKVNSEIIVFIKHYKEMMERYIMENSEIQDVCRQIYKNHSRALKLIFKHVGDRRQEIFQNLTDVISDNQNLILDDSTKSYIRFWSKELDFIPKKGEGWTKNIQRILLFEIYNRTDGLTLYLMLGPGDAELRERIHEYVKEKNLININKNRALSKQYFAIYKRKLLKSEEYEQLESDEIKELIIKKIDKFLKKDYEKIASVLKQLEGKLH